jgi:protein-S-isoprenylcysteine O-methyltransferase Ste14
MKKQERNKYILGYIIGLVIFIVLIPFLIYCVSELNYGFFDIAIIPSDVIRLIIAGILFVLGAIFTVWSNIDLFRVGKGGPTDFHNVIVSPRSKQLVITGPYRYTRNPMVFGTNAIYFSIAVFLNSFPSLLFCLLFIVFHISFVKRTEEKRLLHDFGDAYADYKKSVPMIFPLPRR